MDFTKQNWVDVSNKFFSTWNMPNCLGAIDGKHIKLKCPPNAGSLYYNYKVIYTNVYLFNQSLILCYCLNDSQRYHSIILMAVCDADYRFIYVDVGSPGADGDTNVFARSTFGADILQNSDALNFPEDSDINGKTTPFFFVADDAFPLSKRIMKPYGGTLTNEQRIFNYRLSRARRTIENAFGILVMRWGCLRSEFLCYPDKTKLIVAACCALHNYLQKRNPMYLKGIDSYDKDGHLIEGEWRKIAQMDQINLPRRGRPSESGSVIRETLKHFFNNVNILSFQYDRAFCSRN